MAKSEELTKIIEDNLDKILEEEGYLKLLSVMSRFHHYSFLNQMLILIQKPDAFRVRGYKAWQDNNRQVVKNEKGISILAPKKTIVYIDTQNKQELKKKDIKKSELELGLKTGRFKKKEKHIGYIGVTVFDISQTVIIDESIDIGTDGLGEYGLKGGYEDINSLVKAVEASTGYKVEISKKLGLLEAMGYCDKQSKEIKVRDVEGGLQVAKTLIHEAAHATIENLRSNHKNELKKMISNGIELKNITEEHKESDKKYKLSRAEEEVVVESIAYVILKELGYDSSEYSFGYINIWATNMVDMERYKEDKEVEELTKKDVIEGVMKYITEGVDVLLSGLKINANINLDEDAQEEEENTKLEQAENLLSQMEANYVNKVYTGALI